MHLKVKHISIVSLSTLGSRVLGLLRDVLIFSFFGVSVVNSAFILAFTLPNLFRRLLGEGALTSALMPVMAQELEDSGKEEAFSFLNKVLSRLTLLLAVLVVLSMVALQFVPLLSAPPERWYLGAHLAAILMPYMLLVCLAAIFSAALNLLNRFAIAALSPVWLNLAMIVGLGGFGAWFGNTPEERVYYLCAGVLVGGFFQLLLPVIALKREGWKPQWDSRRIKALDEMVALFIPGLIGAAVFQVNIVVVRLLAFALDNAAVSVLYLASRLVELPLGVFTIAITTVVFPSITKLAAKGAFPDFSEEFAHGMRLILAVTVPAATGLIVLSKPILTLIFEWGAFSAHDVSLVAPVLVISAIGLPFYSMATMATRGFHALKDTRTPVAIGLCSFILNLGLALWWMQRWGVIGLAAASVASACFQNIALRVLLIRKQPLIRKGRFWFPLIEVVAASKIMAIIVWLGMTYGTALWGAGKLGDVLSLIITIPVGVIFYLLFLKVFRFQEVYEIKHLFLKVFFPFAQKKRPTK